MMIKHIPDAVAFDSTSLPRGTPIYAKHSSWKKGTIGMVSRVTDKNITVIFLPEITNTQNHFFIPLEEVLDGQWDIRYSTDELQSISTYPEEGGISNGAE